MATDYHDGEGASMAALPDELRLLIIGRLSQLRDVAACAAVSTLLSLASPVECAKRLYARQPCTVLAAGAPLPVVRTLFKCWCVEPKVLHIPYAARGGRADVVAWLCETLGSSRGDWCYVDLTEFDCGDTSARTTDAAVAAATPCSFIVAVEQDHAMRSDDSSTSDEDIGDDHDDGFGANSDEPGCNASLHFQMPSHRSDSDSDNESNSEPQAVKPIAREPSRAGNSIRSHQNAPEAGACRTKRRSKLLRSSDEQSSPEPTDRHFINKRIRARARSPIVDEENETTARSECAPCKSSHSPGPRLTQVLRCQKHADTQDDTDDSTSECILNQKLTDSASSDHDRHHAQVVNDSDTSTIARRVAMRKDRCRSYNERFVRSKRLSSSSSSSSSLSDGCPMSDGGWHGGCKERRNNNGRTLPRIGTNEWRACHRTLGANSNATSWRAPRIYGHARFRPRPAASPPPAELPERARPLMERHSRYCSIFVPDDESIATVRSALTSSIGCAAEHGQVDVLRYLTSSCLLVRRPGALLLTQAVANAARGGNVAVVAFAHDRWTKGRDAHGSCFCPSEIADAAARAKHSHILEWMHTVNCQAFDTSPGALCNALADGDPTRLALLGRLCGPLESHERIPSKYVARACCDGHVGALAVAHAMGLADVTALELCYAAATDRVDVLRWAAGEAVEDVAHPLATGSALSWHVPSVAWEAAAHGSMATIAWLGDQPLTRAHFTPRMARTLAARGYWRAAISIHDAHLVPIPSWNALEVVTRFCSARSVAYVAERGGIYTSDVLSAAVNRGRLDIVSYLCRWYGTRDAQAAVDKCMIEVGNACVIRFLRHHADACVASLVPYFAEWADDQTITVCRRCARRLAKPCSCSRCAASAYVHE